MRRQILWANAIICAATFSIAVPPATYARDAQPPAHAQSDKNKDKNKKDKKDKKDKAQADTRGQERGHVDPREWNPRFRGLDRNNNHVVSRSEWDGDDRSFANHDWNRDGVLSADELVAGAARPDADRRDADRSDADRRDAERRAADRRDTARDRDRRGHEPDEVLFARMDTNRDNSLSRSEWTGTAADFERLDFNKDGVLSPYEFGVGR
jgi:hypothetical protein